ncbi:MAG TPA: bifunctional glutamate N-acetyltransferase/amino-acid acetyltransferase ArgJ [Candidatus Limnocylindrales bacterium]
MSTPRVEERAELPGGFRAGGLSAGIKASGRPDLGVVVMAGREPATAAAIFTTNLIQAAPVRMSRRHLEQTAGRVRALIVTSGCANAATGPAGDEDQAAIAEALATTFGIEVVETVAASTGLIGTRLPVDRVRDGLTLLAAEGMRTDAGGWEAFGTAIMTTDSRRKAATTTIALPTDDLSLRLVRVSGVAKGVGMIHPRMATMIAVVLTDAAASPELLATLLSDASAATFEQTSIDGDTSTNDTVFVLASGTSDAESPRPGSPEAEQLGAALTAVCRSLARQQAADGEGATTLITCLVTGAADVTDARAVSRAVVRSNLLKAAVHGRDPNWGRVAAAAGAALRPDGSPVDLDAATLTIGLAGSAVFSGLPLPFDAAAVSAAMDAPELVIEVDLARGTASAEAFGCDLTEAYVLENSAYST